MELWILAVLIVLALSQDDDMTNVYIRLVIYSLYSLISGYAQFAYFVHGFLSVVVIGY